MYNDHSSILADTFYVMEDLNNKNVKMATTMAVVVAVTKAAAAAGALSE